jgi:threonine dehydrogenase-like Zn-dependent dehydrogenase
MVYPIPDNLSLEHAALTEPLACAIRAVQLAAVTPFDKVLIIGLGPIGLMILQVIQDFGVTEFFTTDTDPDRRAMGEYFNVRVFDPLAEDVVSLIQTETRGAGVEVAIDAVGSGMTRKQCLQAVIAGGQAVYIGLHEEESEIPVNLAIRKEINLQSSFAYTPTDFEAALDWLLAGRIYIDPWLVKTPLNEGRDSFERLLDNPGPVAKILLYPE